MHQIEPPENIKPGDDEVNQHVEISCDDIKKAPKRFAFVRKVHSWEPDCLVQ